MNKKTKKTNYSKSQLKARLINVFKNGTRSFNQKINKWMDKKNSPKRLTDPSPQLKSKVTNMFKKAPKKSAQKINGWFSYLHFRLDRHLKALKHIFGKRVKEKETKDNKEATPGFSLDKYFLKMSAQEQIIFAKRLAILIKAGVPIMTALDMLSKQSESKSGSRIIVDLLARVERGQSLGKAMESHRRIFGNFAINIISIGEMSGTLTDNLHYLADELKKSRDLKRNIIGALIYPAFIMVATIGIVILLTVYVFPKILPIFSSFKADLPWSTKILIAFSTAMQHYWVYMLAGFFVVTVAGSLLLRIHQIRLFADRCFLRLPILGPMFRNYYIANFSRMLGLLLKTEIGIMQALEIVGDNSGNAAYRLAFSQIAEGVSRGESVSKNMAKEKLLFPPLVSQMAGVGEMTGNLSSSFMYLSEMYEDEMNNLTKNLSTSIEPVLMIVMGVLVGFIAVSIITPIYGITQSLHQ